MDFGTTLLNIIIRYKGYVYITTSVGLFLILGRRARAPARDLNFTFYYYFVVVLSPLRVKSFDITEALVR